jgi:hypothetical protein
MVRSACLLVASCFLVGCSAPPAGSHADASPARDGAAGDATLASDGPEVDASSDADLIWKSDFETGDLSEWSQIQACPGGVTVVTSPVRHGMYAARFAVADDDTNARCLAVPTENPRAQLVGPFGLFQAGDDVYIGFSTFFPADFPTVPAGSWLQLHEDYGPPYNGSPTMEVDVYGDRLGMEANENDGIYHRIWTAGEDIHRGTQWEDIVLHVKWSTDPAVGFIELWYDGVPQTFADGETREHVATLVPSINGLFDTVYMNQYRKAGVDLGTVVLYHDDIRVGRTYASVAR